MKNKIPFLTAFVAVALALLGCASETTSTENQLDTPDIPASLVKSETINAAVVENGNISLKTGLDHTTFLADGGSRTGYLYVETKAGKSERIDDKRTPLNLSIVIDRSGSMDGQKLRYAKEAAEFVVGQLSSEDYLSIVVYDDEVSIISSAAHVTNKEALRKQIRNIRTDGSTNLHGGMMEGYAQVKRNHSNGYVNRVLLLSDGLANAGITSQTELQQIAKTKSNEHGISISTFGIGNDFNENLMTGLSEYGSGNYYFIEEPGEIPTIFEKELKGLLAVVAQNAKLKIDLPSGVKLDKLFGYKYDQKGNQVTVNFRDVFSEETKAIMLRFTVEDANLAPFNFRTTLTYNDASDEAQQNLKLEKDDLLTKAAGIPDWERSEDEEIMAQAVLFESNDRLEEAMRLVDERDYDKARKTVKENEEYLRDNVKYVDKSEELQEQENTNTSYRDKIKNAEVMSESEMKSVQKSTKSYNYQTRKKK